MSGDRFEVPSPSEKAVRECFTAWRKCHEGGDAFELATRAAYAVDLPAIVEAEVRRALRAAGVPERPTGEAYFIAEATVEAYCLGRFGPEPAIVSSSRLNCTCPRPSEKYTGDCPVHPRVDSQLCGAKPCECGWRHCTPFLHTHFPGRPSAIAECCKRWSGPEGAPEPAMGDKFAQSFDARDWAKAFVETVRKHPHIPTDESTMLGWFANALMRGWDERARRHPDRTETTPAYSDAERAFLRALAEEYAPMYVKGHPLGDAARRVVKDA